jgi:hypothetical protein
MDTTLTHLLPSVQDHILTRGITIPAWRATGEERQTDNKTRGLCSQSAQGVEDLSVRWLKRGAERVS